MLASPRALVGGTAAVCLLLVSAFALTAAATPAAKLKTTTLKEKAPETVAAPLRELLADEAIRVVDSKGKPFADVWLRKEIPTVKGKKEVGIYYGQVEEGGFVGVYRLHERNKDFKGTRVPPGVFTMRRGVQPQDGEHLGVSESRDFLLLSPVEIDTKLPAMSTKELVMLSVKASKTKHPAVLFLLKMYDKAEGLPKIVADEDNDLLILDCQTKATGVEKGHVRLGIVVKGESPEA